MPIQIRAADGAVIQFPDGTPPDAIRRGMQRDHLERASHVLLGRQAERGKFGQLHGASLGLQSGLPGFPEVGAGLAASAGAIRNMAQGRPADFGREWSKWRDYQSGLHGQFQQDHPIADSFLRGAGYAAQGALALATGGELSAASIVSRQAARVVAKRSALEVATGGGSANASLVTQQAARDAARRATIALTKRITARVAPNAFTGAMTAAVNGAAQPGTLAQRAQQGFAAIPGGALFGVLAPETVGLAAKGMDMTANALDGVRNPWARRSGNVPEVRPQVRPKYVRPRAVSSTEAPETNAPVVAADETSTYPFKVVDGDGAPPTDWRSPKRLRDRPKFTVAASSDAPAGGKTVEAVVPQGEDNSEAPDFVPVPSKEAARRSRQVQYFAAVDHLLSQGVPLTPGQRSGGIGRQLEDSAMASPKWGASIRQARLLAEKSVMRSEANRWLSPTGEKLPEGLSVGPDMASYVTSRRNAFHDDALSLVKNTKPDDDYKLAAMNTLGLGHDVISKSMWDDLMRKHNLISSSLENPLMASHLRDLFSEIDALKEYYGEDGSTSGKWQRELFGQLGSGLTDLFARNNPLYSAATSNLHAGQTGFDTWRGAMNRLGSANIDFTPANLKSGILVQDAGSPSQVDPDNSPARSQLLDDATIVMGPQAPLPVDMNRTNPTANTTSIQMNDVGNPTAQNQPNAITGLSRAVAAQQSQRAPDGSYIVDVDQSTNPDFAARPPGQ